MNKKLKVVLIQLAVITATVVATLVCACFALGLDFTRLAEQIPVVRKMCLIDSLVEKNAIYQTKTDLADTLANAYIGSAVEDDYAFYLDKDAYSSKKTDWEGVNSKSIGITIAKKENSKYVSVIYVNRNSPAKEAGIKKGDFITAIDGASTKNKSSSDLVEMIKNAKDKVKIKVLRKKSVKTFEVKITDFVSDSVDWRMIDDVGYIRIMDFNETTSAQFNEAVADLKQKGATALVFDLRENTGGTIESCAEVLDTICPSGDTVRMRYKNGDIKTVYKSDKNEIKLPMAVIINGETASASEIFAMNIRDFGKGKLVGEKSFGKGISQTTYNLYDGTAVKFTTAEVVSKDGKSYHKVGLEPDEKVAFSDSQNQNFYFLSDEQDTQLQAALKTVKES